MAVDSGIEPLKAGAPDYSKQREEAERKIRLEVELKYPHLPPEAREAIINSRVGILNNPGKPEIEKVDLGKDAGRKVKDDLFE
jgi:hypothetical protein